ncbi:YijD family membrane protein [Yersinia sp. Marseille-Q3913]|uniref:YijD family membrane protein n=1 Tax=Yersinia sp. Marseille-Q3913 TaxID=2830769 RepID=UPI001BAF071F|nr:YijD family membrane protein [Yersinia sp. Marseille-Q3913]MBS0057279.1 YijD family membrane protein [Yersinia sp. Marseille-Q3913]
MMEQSNSEKQSYLEKQSHHEKQPRRETGTLLLALITGLAINGSFNTLFSALVPFSIFPLLTLILAVYCLHQRYLNFAMPQGLPVLAAACFLLGILVYSAIVRVEHPAIGSNFVPSILSVALVFWILFKLKARKSAQANTELESDNSDSQQPQ